MVLQRTISQIFSSREQATYLLTYLLTYGLRILVSKNRKILDEKLPQVVDQYFTEEYPEAVVQRVSAIFWTRKVFKAFFDDSK